ncbi:MAG: hypothetical protein LBR75_00510 [Prevotellaceae bacterium]|jgi:hypothetical protein|nr:hypothetical protein [Prevotellaceae bacterium]
MKRLSWSAFSFLIFAATVYSQSKLGEQYAVPESPAFSLLDNQSGNIITPSSVKKISLELTDYKNFGIEISPLLLTPNLNLEDYNKALFWYRMRFSFAKSTLGNENVQFAEGLRFTLIDKSDLRDAKIHYQYHNDLSAIAQNKCLELNIIDCTNIVDSLRNAYKKEFWNAEILEVGLASMQESMGSETQDFKFRKAALWISYGTHLGKLTTKFGQSNQLLIGLNAELTDSISVEAVSKTYYPKLSTTTRFYYGSNELRVYIQAEYAYINAKNKMFLAAIGGLLKVYSGIWIKPALSVNSDFDGKPSYTPSLTLQAGLGFMEKTK